MTQEKPVFGKWYPCTGDSAVKPNLEGHPWGRQVLLHYKDWDEDDAYYIWLWHPKNEFPYEVGSRSIAWTYLPEFPKEGSL